MKKLERERTEDKHEIFLSYEIEMLRQRIHSHEELTVLNRE